MVLWPVPQQRGKAAPPTPQEGAQRVRALAPPPVPGPLPPLLFHPSLFPQQSFANPPELDFFGGGGNQKPK